MHVLAVVPSVYDTSPGQRFRIEQWEPMLRENGVEITYAPFETDELRAILYSGGKIFEKIGGVTRSLKRRIDELSQLSKFDLVYVFREAALLGPPWFERKIGRSGVPMVFDFDDAIFFSYKSPSNGYLSYLKFPGKTAEICRLSTHVMAGNEFLADYARSSNNNVTIIPTTIDTDKYEFVERTDNPEIVTIGWSGSFSTVQHLDTIRDVLQELAKTEQFRLSVIGTPTYKLAGVDAEAIQWRSITEIEDLRRIDIGLMPLPDDNWSKGKCGLKALQYMALGIPTICSPVGVNSTIIKDSENGFLAESSEEWIEKIKRLIHSPELRQKLGRSGSETVEREYSAKVVAPKVLEVFRSTMNSSKQV
ncbi:MAG: glycosyltransferase family 4 protein [Chloracidobacterium sp.]|nr:glycosyltransferase family 4 protein [Chloracidobacterium sp.]